MMINVDKRFIEILNKRGYKITWEQFMKAYSVRKEERKKTPKKPQEDLSVFESMFIK
jgi:hypothetical protein